MRCLRSAPDFCFPPFLVKRQPFYQWQNLHLLLDALAAVPAAVLVLPLQPEQKSSSQQHQPPAIPAGTAPPRTTQRGDSQLAPHQGAQHSIPKAGAAVIAVPVVYTVTGQFNKSWLLSPGPLQTSKDGDVPISLMTCSSSLLPSQWRSTLLVSKWPKLNPLGCNLWLLLFDIPSPTTKEKDGFVIFANALEAVVGYN